MDTFLLNKLRYCVKLHKNDNNIYIYHTSHSYGGVSEACIVLLYTYNYSYFSILTASQNEIHK